MGSAEPKGIFCIRKIQGKALQQLHCCLEMTNDDISLGFSMSIVWIYNIS